jgi:DNA (cytosine-5)-methyltransferase 1
MKKPVIVDLFAGAGGLSEGFREAGFDVVWANDHIPVFCETYRRNHPKTLVFCGDIREINADKIKNDISGRNVDVVIGGPPCQGFSIAGRRDINDPRNSLFMEFVRMVDGLKPKYFVMENVPGILTMATAKNENVVEIIEKEFEKIGYKMKYKKLRAADYGVPQKRQRVIFIGTNTGKPISHPIPTHSEKPFVTVNGNKIEKWVPVKSMLLPKNKVEKKFFHTQKMIEGFVKRKARNSKNGHGFGWQILDPEKPSYTISARYWKDGSDALVKYSDNEVRMLTPLECARIQTFPDNYVFAGSKRDQYTQIGNAVPVLLAQAIAKTVKKSL